MIEGKFCTGFREYSIIEIKTITIDIIVFHLILMLKIIQLNIVINISSSAEAIVFNIEFKYFKKKLVTIPTLALFIITNNT